jgi:hypothetical protein
MRLNYTVLFIVLVIGLMGASCGGPAPTGNIASISLSPATSSVGVGQTQRFTAIAKDTNGNVLPGASLTWSSSDTTVASISEGTVTALAKGTTNITALGDAVTSNIAVLTVTDTPGEPSGPSSFDLIDEALAAGEIDQETALVYRVFATFKDARLPSQFRSDTIPMEGQDLLEVFSLLPNLSASAQATLEPFLIPPIYKSSWLSVSAPNSLRATSLSIRCGDELREDWYSVARPNGRFRVWYSANDTSETYASVALNALEDEIYPKLIGLGLKAPASDFIHDCNGGDEKLDVYLVPNFGAESVNNALGLAEPQCGSGTGVSSYLLAKDGMSEEQLKSTLAHEFMHAVQFEYRNIRCLGNYRWLMEATATWAKDFVYPTNNLEHPYAPPFLETPEKSLDDPKTKDGKDYRKYGAYLFFQFLTKTLGNDRIKAIFEASEHSVNSLDAVDSSIPGGFKDQWWKFAKTLWNQAPIDTQANSFKQWDDMTQTPDKRDIDGNLNGAPEARYELDTSWKHLSSRYYHFTFDDPNTRSLLFYNGFFEFARATGRTIKVHALWKDEAGTWQEEDWSDYKYVGLCRDLKNQRASELVLIVSNVEKDASIDLGLNPNLSPVPYLKRSNIGCYKYSGTVTMLNKYSFWSGLGRRAVSNLVFELDPSAKALDAKSQFIPDSLRVGISALMFLSGTDYSFEVQYSDATCSYSFEPGSFPLSQSPGFLFTNPFPKLETTDATWQKWFAQASRAYSGVAVDDQQVTVNVSGRGCAATILDKAGVLLLTNDAKDDVVISPPVAQPDGTLKGTFTNAGMTFDWTLSPEREP